MSITFGEAKQIVSQYAGRGGKCPDDPTVPLFVREVLQLMLNSGEYGSYRKFCFIAEKGCFTAPYELETPLKAKIEDEVVSVWDKWFEWYSTRDIEGCTIVSSSILEDPNYYPTTRELPESGAYVATLGFCEESPDAHIIVQGLDPSGVDVFTVHNGRQIHGEYLRIQKGQIRFSTVKFGKITQVIKTGSAGEDDLTRTKGYVQLLTYNPINSKQSFLAGYSPVETKPQYRRFRLNTAKCGPRVKLSVLATIRIKNEYDDSDILPFDNIRALKLAAQTCNADYIQDVQLAQAKEQSLDRLIEKENEMKSVKQGQPIDCYKGTSAGMIKNINTMVSPRFWLWRR